jgi:hypothetical protein
MRITEILLPKNSKDKSLDSKESKKKLDMLKQDVMTYTDKLSSPDLKSKDKSLLKKKLEQAKEEIKELSEKLKISESIHTIPLTDKQFDELKERLNHSIPAEIAQVLLGDVLETDDLRDEFIAAAKNNPNYDVRPLVVNWLELNMPDQMYRFTGKRDEDYLIQGTYSTIHGYPVPGGKSQGLGDTTNVLGRY